MKVSLDKNAFENGKSYHYICKYCKEKLCKGKHSPISHKNKLATYKPEIFEEQELNKYNTMELTELEQCLIARSILFMKMKTLPGGDRMKAVRDRLINVPICENDIFDTLGVITPKLPRTPNEARIVSVGLKKKKIYKGSDRKEYVETNPIVMNEARVLQVSEEKYLGDWLSEKNVAESAWATVSRRRSEVRGPATGLHRKMGEAHTRHGIPMPDGRVRKEVYVKMVDRSVFTVAIAVIRDSARRSSKLFHISEADRFGAQMNDWSELTEVKLAARARLTCLPEFGAGWVRG